MLREKAVELVSIENCETVMSFVKHIRTVAHVYKQLHAHVLVKLCNS